MIHVVKFLIGILGVSAIAGFILLLCYKPEYLFVAIIASILCFATYRLGELIFDDMPEKFKNWFIKRRD
jgi:hypothetical protein